MQHITNIEDARAIKTGENTLTDEELHDKGLVKTSAFVRTEVSKNALRVKKAREKKEDKGLKQLNIEVPEESRSLIKAAVKKMKEGVSFEDAFKVPVLPKDPKTEKLVQRVAKIKKAGGLKAWLLNLILQE